MSQCQTCGGRATVFLCAPCTNQLRAALTSLATGPAVNGRRSSGLLEDLTDVALKRTRLGGDTSHRKRGDTMPALYEPDTEKGRRTKQADASILLDAIGNGLTTIVRDLCETRATPLLVAFKAFDAIGPLLPGWRRVAPDWQPTTHEDARWLAEHVSAIACDESAGVWHDEISGYVRRIERCIDRPARRRWLGPCPKWNEQTRKACGVDLYAHEDAIEVHCRTCRTTHNCNRLKLLQQNDIERELLTWDRVLKANKWQPDDCRVPERTLRIWRKTGRLKPRGWLRPNGRHGGTQHSADDQPLYRWQDVRRLRAEKPQRANTGAAAHRK